MAGVHVDVYFVLYFTDQDASVLCGSSCCFRLRRGSFGLEEVRAWPRSGSRGSCIMNVSVPTFLEVVGGLESTKTS